MNEQSIETVDPSPAGMSRRSVPTPLSFGTPGHPVRSSLQRRLYEECVTAGWDPDRGNTFAEECAHLHEEVSEAFRAWRLHQDAEIRYSDTGKPEGVPIELADVLIGLFYNAEVMGFDLLEAVEVKHRYNLTRNYVAEGRQLHARPRTDAPSSDIEEHAYYSGRARRDGDMCSCPDSCMGWALDPDRCRIRIAALPRDCDPGMLGES